jgi:hypothetical protein
MTEQNYLKSFIKDWWKYWLVGTLFGLVLGYLTTARLMPKYQGLVLFTLVNKPALVQKDTPFYLYDGYYNEQAALTARNNLANWLTASKTVYDIYSLAGITPSAPSAQSLNRLFEISDINGTTGANTVNLITTSGTQQEADRLAKAVIDYTRDHYMSDSVTPVMSGPLVLEVQPTKKLILLGITLATAFSVFLLTLIIHYFKQD